MSGIATSSKENNKNAGIPIVPQEKENKFIGGNASLGEKNLMFPRGRQFTNLQIQ